MNFGYKSKISIWKFGVLIAGILFIFTVAGEIYSSSQKSSIVRAALTEAKRQCAVLDKVVECASTEVRAGRLSETECYGTQCWIVLTTIPPSDFYDASMLVRKVNGKMHATGFVWENSLSYPSDLITH